MVLRYADVLLMLAECLNEKSFGSAESFTMINQTRIRAGLPKLDLVTTPSQDAFRTALLNERRFEFAFEFQRWFDLLRSGSAQKILNDKGLALKQFQILFPIPQRERDLIPDLLPQNIGY